MRYHKLFHFHLSFWIWKVWKQRKKVTKIWILWQRKELFRWNKRHFSQFLKGHYFVKNTKQRAEAFNKTLVKLYIWFHCLLLSQVLKKYKNNSLFRNKLERKQQKHTFSFFCTYSFFLHPEKQLESCQYTLSMIIDILLMWRTLRWSQIESDNLQF